MGDAAGKPGRGRPDPEPDSVRGAPRPPVRPPAAAQGRQRQRGAKFASRRRRPVRGARLTGAGGSGPGSTGRRASRAAEQRIPGGRGEGLGRSLLAPPRPGRRPRRPPARPSHPAPLSAPPPPPPLPGGAHDPPLVALRRETRSPTPSAKRPKWRTYQAGLGCPPPVPSLRPPRSQSRTWLRPLGNVHWSLFPAPPATYWIAQRFPCLHSDRLPSLVSQARGGHSFPMDLTDPEPLGPGV